LPENPPIQGFFSILRDNQNFGITARGTETGFAGEGDAMLILATGTKITGIATLRVTAEHHTLNNVLDVSLLIEGDLVGQAEVAVALPVVKEDLAEAVVPGWVVERPGRGSLILKEWRVFDGEVSGYCVTGIYMR
jgi:hypothetical protein